MAGKFLNTSGQEPSPPSEDENSPDPHAELRVLRPHMFNRYVEQVGFLPIDTETCQAPVVFSLLTEKRVRCANKAVCVMVENKPRANGKIAAMSLCKIHKEIMLMSHGPDYAAFTTLEEVPPTNPPVKP